MTGDEATVAVIEALESEQIPYMLVGSLSSNFHGTARSTKDSDLVISLGSRSYSSVARKLAPLLQPDPQITFESVTGTTRHIINVPDSPFRIELFRLSDDPHDQARFQRRRQEFISQLNRNAFVATAEDVIITKLRWAVTANRGKDRDDVRDVIAVQGDKLDWNYIHSWCNRHGTRALLDEIRCSIPPL